MVQANKLVQVLRVASGRRHLDLLFCKSSDLLVKAYRDRIGRSGAF